MARPPARNSKPDDILLAAREVFLAHGYEGASVDLIAAKANVSKATLYAHFGGKEPLFAQMVEGYCAAQETAIAAIEAEHPETTEGLFRVTMLVLTGWSEPNALKFGRMIMGESARFPRLGRVFAQSGAQYLQRIVTAMFKRLAGEGALTLTDPDMTAELFIAMTRSTVQTRSLLKLGKPPSRAELSDIAHAIVETVVGAHTRNPDTN